MASWLLDDQLVDRLIQSDSASVNVVEETKPRVERYACGKRKARPSSEPWGEHQHLKRQMDEFGSKFVRVPPPDDDPSMDLATAERIAESEGFYILRSVSSKTGFHGTRKKNNVRGPVFIAYAARGRPCDKMESLGSYSTLAQAALVASRSLFQKSGKNAVQRPRMASARFETPEEASEAAEEIYSSVVVEIDE